MSKVKISLELAIFNSPYKSYYLGLAEFYLFAGVSNVHENLPTMKLDEQTQQ